MMFFGQGGVECEKIEDDVVFEAGVELFIARFDEVHPVVSGNKMYKLHYFLQQAIEENKPIVTFGGPYSNHLAATAQACKILKITCTGIVNGEHHSITHTLKQCEEEGMELKYVSPGTYRRLKSGIEHELYPGALVIPEGGYHPLGAKGASLMSDEISSLTVTHTCVSVGTATTLAGFLAKEGTEIIAIPAIKNMTDIPERLKYLEINYQPARLKIWDEYHFGGFAKLTPELEEFMKNFKLKYEIELDRVYTAKMIFGVLDKISKKYFPRGSRIVCVHSGGLQGNK